MKKPVKDYKTDYPVDEKMKQYYGNCETCNQCNDCNDGNNCNGVNIK